MASLVLQQHEHQHLELHTRILLGENLVLFGV